MKSSIAESLGPRLRPEGLICRPIAAWQNRDRKPPLLAMNQFSFGRLTRAEGSTRFVRFERR